MKEHGVIPIAVFDGVGERPWKAVAHSQREQMRSLSLSRSLQEEARRERMEKLGDVLNQAGTSASDKSEVLQVITELKEELALSRRPHDRARGRSLAEIAVKLQLGDEAKSGQEAGAAQGEASVVIPDETAVEVESKGGNFIPTEEEDLIQQAVEPLSGYTETARQTELNKQEDTILDDATRALTTEGTTGLAEIEDLSRQREELVAKAKVISLSYDRSLEKPRESDMKEAKEMLEAMGVPVLEVDAPWEAEGLCAAMVIGGLADFVGTEDTDVLAYSSVLLRDVASSRSPLSIVNGVDLHERFGLSPAAYIDLMIMCGMDACERIHGIGPKRSLTFLLKHGSIEKILAKASFGKVPVSALIKPGYMERVAAARRVYQDLPPLPPLSDLKQIKVSDDEVAAFLRERYGIVLAAPLPADAFLHPEDGDFGSQGEVEEPPAWSMQTAISDDDLAQHMLAISSAQTASRPQIKTSAPARPAGKRMYSTSTRVDQLLPNPIRNHKRAVYVAAIRNLQRIPDPHIR